MYRVYTSWVQPKKMKNTWQKNWEKTSNFQKQEYRFYKSWVFFRYFKDEHLRSTDSPYFSQSYRNLRGDLNFLFRLQLVIQKIKVVTENTFLNDEIVRDINHDLDILENNCFSLNNQCKQRIGRYPCRHPAICKQKDSLLLIEETNILKNRNNEKLSGIRSHLSSFGRQYFLNFNCQLQEGQVISFSERMKFQVLKKKIIQEMKSNYYFQERELCALSELSYREDYYFVAGELTNILIESYISTEERRIVKNYLEILNKSDLLHQGLPFFEEFKTGTQNFVKSIGKASDTFLTKKDYLWELVKKLPEKRK